MLAEAFKILLEEDSESVIQRFVALFEEQGVDLLREGRKEPLRLVDQQTSDSLVALSEFEDMTLEEAASITQGYMSEITRMGMNGQAWLFFLLTGEDT